MSVRVEELNAASFQEHLCRHLYDIMINIYKLDIVSKVVSQAPSGVS